MFNRTKIFYDKNTYYSNPPYRQAVVFKCMLIISPLTSKTKAKPKPNAPKVTREQQEHEKWHRHNYH